MIIALLLAAVPVNAPVVIPSAHFAVATDVGTPAPVPATHQTAGAKLPCVDRAVRYGFEFIAAGALSDFAVIGTLECFKATGMDEGTAYVLAGASYFIVAPTTAAIAAWGMSRLFEERKCWGHAFLGAEAGAVLASTLVMAPGLLCSGGSGPTMDILMTVALLSFPAIGAVVGLNL